MGLSDSSVKLLLFFLVFSIMFPVFGYALTFGATVDTGSISHEDLLQAGIIMNSADSQNVTRGGGWVVFSVEAQDYRVGWGGDLFTIQIPSEYVGWLWPTKIGDVNETRILEIFNTSYNWSYFRVDDGGAAEADLLFTVYPGAGNMTNSLTVGNVTLTIGRGFETQAADLMAFAGWFSGIVFGWATSGLPAFFVWLIRIIALIGLATAVLLVKEFIPLLP